MNMTGMKLKRQRLDRYIEFPKVPIWLRLKWVIKFVKGYICWERVDHKCDVPESGIDEKWNVENNVLNDINNHMSNTLNDL